MRGLARMRPGYLWDERACRWERRVAPDKNLARAGVKWDAASDAFPHTAKHEPLAGQLRGDEVTIGDAEGVLPDGPDDAAGDDGGERRRQGRRGRGRGRSLGGKVGALPAQPAGRQRGKGWADACAWLIQSRLPRRLP